jgi:hypothetical protein
MFDQQQASQRVAPTSSGIGGMTTPDQNAQALKTMFAPQIPATPPTQSFPVPQAGYKRGGEVIDGVAHFQEGGESVAVDPMGNPTGYAAPAPTPVPERIAERLTQEDNRPRVDMPAVDPMGNVTGGVMSVPVPPSVAAPSGPVSGKSVIIPANTAYPGRGDPNFNEPPADVPDFRPGRAAPAAAKGPTDLELQLQSIKARRETSDKQREENKWMALLSAGLGMMAGKDRNALANIGAGGQQGLATFAGLEKGRREDEATARREDLLTRQLAQQKEIAFAQMAQDPDTVRLYKALGGGDLEKGFRLVSSDATLKSAQLIAADITAPEPERARARAFLNGRIEEAMGVRTGSTQGFDPSKFSVKTVR